MELEDQHWFPAFLRNQQTAFIGFVAGAFGIYNPLLGQLKELLELNNDTTWTDCCSGAAGPVLYLQEKIQFSGTILLTDKFPNKNFIINNNVNVAYLNTPLDILQNEVPNKGLVTMFNAFHHFNAIEKKQIIEHFIENSRPFLIAEILQPTFFEAIKILLVSTIGQLLLCPFVKPFSFSRLIFTYLIPINIITVLWDGIISVMKSVPFSQFKKMAETFTTNKFQVEAVKNKRFFATITFIVGMPVK